MLNKMILDKVKYVFDKKPEGFSKFIWHSKDSNICELTDLEKPCIFYIIKRSHISEDGVEEFVIEGVALDKSSITPIDVNLLEELKKDEDHVYYVYSELNNLYAVKILKSDCKRP